MAGIPRQTCSWETEADLGLETPWELWRIFPGLRGSLGCSLQPSLPVFFAQGQTHLAVLGHSLRFLSLVVPLPYPLVFNLTLESDSQRTCTLPLRRALGSVLVGRLANPTHYPILNPMSGLTEPLSNLPAIARCSLNVGTLMEKQR